MIVHLNGQLLPLSQAAISPLDRGFVFGDGVYEGVRSFGIDGKTHLVAMERHVARMSNGLREAGIAWDTDLLAPATRALLEANAMPDAFIYWQVTRGTPGPGDPPRSRVPAKSATRPTVFGYCSPQPSLDAFAGAPATRRAVTCEDTRWALGHIKSISLMGNVMLAMRADAAGADDAILVRSRGGGGTGLVAEGTATNVVLALDGAGSESDGRGGRLVTPSLDSVPILAGITRALLLEAVPELVDRPVHADELDRASEIMLVGTTTMVASVVALDGRTIGDGTPGPRARRLLAALVEWIRREAADAPVPAVRPAGGVVRLGGPH